MRSGLRPARRFEPRVVPFALCSGHCRLFGKRRPMPRTNPVSTELVSGFSPPVVGKSKQTGRETRECEYPFQMMTIT
jgi:hypothetical protein